MSGWNAAQFIESAWWRLMIIRSWNRAVPRRIAWNYYFYTECSTGFCSTFRDKKMQSKIYVIPLHRYNLQNCVNFFEYIISNQIHASSQSVYHWINFYLNNYFNRESFVIYKWKWKNKNKLFVISTSPNTLFKIMRLTVIYKYNFIFYLSSLLIFIYYLSIIKQINFYANITFQSERFL